MSQGTSLKLAVLPRHISESHPSTGAIDLCCRTQVLYMIGIQTQVLMCAAVSVSPTASSVQPPCGIFPCHKVFYFIDGLLLLLIVLLL